MKPISMVKLKTREPAIHFENITLNRGILKEWTNFKVCFSLSPEIRSNSINRAMSENNNFMISVKSIAMILSDKTLLKLKRLVDAIIPIGLATDGLASHPTTPS